MMNMEISRFSTVLVLVRPRLRVKSPSRRGPAPPILPSKLLNLSKNPAEATEATLLLNSATLSWHDTVGVVEASKPWGILYLKDRSIVNDPPPFTLQRALLHRS